MAKFKGTGGADSYSGTSRRDKIFGRAGDDTLYGLDGDDRIYGGRGDDEIHGGADDDLISGGAGNDRLYGGDGNDTVKASRGDDTVSGGAGNNRIDTGDGDDVITSGFGDDRINTGRGDDRVTVDGGQNRIDTGAGNDTVAVLSGAANVTSGNGDDAVTTAEGDDRIRTGSGDDVVSAGNGDDTIDTGSGDDTVHGGGGDDRIDGGAGNDSLMGGDGNDTLRGDGGSGSGSGSGHHGRGSGSGSGSGHAYGSGSGSGFPGGATFDDYLDGGAGNDLAIGGLGEDTVLGGAGDDRLFGDAMFGAGSGSGSGHHHGHGSGSGSGSRGRGSGSGSGSASDIGFGFSDYLDGGAGDDLAFGGGGNDILVQTIAENTGATDDYRGGRGIDTLVLNFTRAEWLDPRWQADVAGLLAFIASETNPATGEASSAVYTTHSGLSVREVEALRIFVDGVELDPEDAPVLAVDDAVGLDAEPGAVPFGSVVENDDVPDLVERVELVSGPTLGTLALNADGTFSFDPGNDFDDLALGEPRDVSFVYQVFDADGDSDAATVTLTVIGTNEAPVVVSSTDPTPVTELADGATGEGVEILEATGQVTFSDANLLDMHSVSVIGRTVVDQASGLTVPARGMLTAAISDPATGDGSGAIDWRLAVSDGDLDDLAAGQVLTETFTLQIDDARGGVTETSVDVLFVGTNDTPVLGSPASVIALTELADGAAGEGTTTLTGSSALPFVDADLIDVHSVSITGVVALDSLSGAVVPLGTLTPSSTTTGGGTGTVAWTFAVEDADLEGLAEGQVVRQVYTLTVDDGQGGVASHDVEVRLVGANDGPTITADAVGAVTEDVDPVAGMLQTAGSIALADPDAADTLTVSAGLSGIVYSGGMLTPAETAALTGAGNFTADASGWSYSVSNADVQFLGETEAVTLTYLLTADDGSGATSSTTATVTINGQNDAPGIALSGSADFSENDALGAPLDADGLVTITDVDRNDLIGLSASLTTTPAWSAGFALPSNLQMALANGLTLGSTDVGAPSATPWEFAALADVEFLAAGETIDLGFTIIADDGNGGVASAPLAVRIDGQNDTPEIGNGQIRLTEGDAPGLLTGSSLLATFDADFTDIESVSGVSLLTADVDGTSVAADLAMALDGALVAGVDAATDGQVTGTVLATFSADAAPLEQLAEGETLTVIYEVDFTDGIETATGRMTVTIAGSNDDPVARDDVAATTENAPVFIAFSDLLSNDGDVDGDSLTVTAVNGTSALGAALVSGPTGVTYQPGGVTALDGAGEVLTDSFTYTVSDGNGGFATGQVSVAVQTINDTPVAADDTRVGVEDQTLVILVADLLANDEDGDAAGADQPLTIVSVGNPIGGTVQLVGGTVEFMPDPNRSGVVSFDYTMSDGALTDTATVTIDLAPVQDPPVALDDDQGAALVIEAGSAGTGQPNAAGNVLDNDFDPDGDMLVVQGVAAGATAGPVSAGTAVSTDVEGTYGTVRIDANGVWQYALDNTDPDTDALSDGQIVFDVFSYTVSDGNGGVDTAQLTVRIEGADDNRAPVVMDDGVTLSEDDTAVIDVLANDSDPDGDPLTLVSVGAAANGTVVIDDMGTATPDDDVLRYTPDADFSGVDSFDYTVTDGSVTVTGSVGVDVTPVADTPVVAIPEPPLLNALTPTPTAGFGDRFGPVNGAGFQGGQRLIALDDGGFLLAWTTTASISNQTPNQIFFRTFDADGTPRTGDIALPISGAFAPTSQQAFDVAQLDDGAVVFTWVESASTSADGTFVRVYPADGSAPITTALYQSGSFPSGNTTVAELADGGFVVAFEAFLQTGPTLFVQRFEANGVSPNPAVAIATSLSGPLLARLDAFDDGGYVVTYRGMGGPGAVSAQVFAPSTTGPEVSGGVLPIVGATGLTNPTQDVAALKDGTFAFVWLGLTASSTLGVRVAQFDADGTMLGPVQVIDSAFGGSISSPDVISLDDGGYLVNWTDSSHGSNSFGVFGQRFDAEGARAGTVFRVDQIANGNEFSQTGEGTAQLEDGSIVAAWITLEGLVAGFPSDSNLQFTRLDLPVAANGLEDQPLSIDLSAALTDLDGSETLDVLLEGFPPGATFNLGSAQGAGWVIENAETVDLSTLVMTPPEDWNGSFTLLATATATESANGDTAQATAQAAFTIAPVPDDPVAGDDAATTQEDTPVTIDVLANDSDADGDALTILSVTQGTNGSVMIDDQGDADPTNDRVVYTPNADFAGTDSFSYTVSDGLTGEGTATVSVTVNPVNDPPQANAVFATVQEGSQSTIGSPYPPVSGPVSENIGSYFLLDGAGAFLGGPRSTLGGADETGIFQFLGPQPDGYIILLDSGTTVGGESTFSAEAFLVVDGVLSAADASLWTVEGYSGTIDATGSTLTGIGADNSFDLRFEVRDLPAPGDKTVSYQVDARRLDLGSSAPDSFFARAVFESELATTLAPVPITLMADVSDIEDALGALTFTVDDSGTAGTVVNNGDGTFSYSAGAVFNALNDGETATDSFVYTVTDTGGNSATATATIQIVGEDPQFTDPFPPDPLIAPVLQNDVFAVPNTGPPASYDVLLNDSDANGDPLTVTAVTQPSAGSVSIVGKALVFDPGAPFAGLNQGQTAQVSVDYTVTDGAFFETATAVFNVTGATPFDPGSQTVSDNSTGLLGQDLTVQVNAGERTNDGTADVAVEVGIGEPLEAFIDVIFVVDRSGSTRFTGTSLIPGVGDQNGDGVEDTVLDAEILAVSNLVDAIVAESYAPGTVTLTLQPFSGMALSATTITLDSTDDPVGGPTDVDAFKAALNALTANGGTNYIPALEAAGDTFDALEVANGAASSSKFLYFLTDGDPADRDNTLPDPFTPIQATTDILTAAGVTMAAVGINANPNAVRQEALDAVDNTGGGVFTTDFAGLDAALLAGAQPDAELLSADVFVFDPSGVQVGQQSYDALDFSDSPFGLSLDLPDVAGFATDFGEISELRVEAGFDTNGDGVEDLTLQTVLEIEGALPDAIFL